jgi:ferredoxin-NADP reductase
VSRITPLTDQITLLAIDVPRSFTFDAGQYVDIVIPERGERRSYSMMNLPGAGRLEFLIKRNANGELPDLLSADVRMGTKLALCGPYGNCVLNPGAMADEYLLIAGGSGIAPMLSLLRAIERSSGHGCADTRERDGNTVAMTSTEATASTYHRTLSATGVSHMPVRVFSAARTS